MWLSLSSPAGSALRSKVARIPLGFCMKRTEPRARPTIVIPADVALGGHSLHKAGIHSPGPSASRIRARTTPFENEPHPQPPLPTIVIPAEVALGVSSLHKAGIHSL